MDAETSRKPLIPSTMNAKTRRKIEEMVMDLLTKAELEKATEFTIRLAASERLGIDLSDSHSRKFVRNIVDSYLISIAKNKKLPQVSTEAVNEPPVAGVTRKNDDSELVICELSSKRKVTVGDYEGRTMVSIREYYVKDGKQLPTTKGMSLSSQQWSTFKNSVPAIEEAITELEGRLRRRSGHSGWKNVPVQPVPIEPASIEPVPIEIVPIEIVRFDGKNYQVWAEQVELLLKQLKIDYVLTEPCPNATLGENDASAGEISKAKGMGKR
ncbi:RNA polymerase II transcriptional coactivator KELP-like [Vicia villosa]|uniref:RNA polymerase II transcriptional coactivator KELP-like n=1 Tax=Vicia villosa TaxID=3911 RepID=UPI00273C6077|nr:RNA polymerase II transcriptional coactivator KELP-like [Vicia villosa]